MEELEQELVPPEVNFNLDVQPYMFEPVASGVQSQEEDINGNESDVSSDSHSNNEQSQDDRSQNTDW